MTHETKTRRDVLNQTIPGTDGAITVAMIVDMHETAMDIDDAESVKDCLLAVAGDQRAIGRVVDTLEAIGLIVPCEECEDHWAHHEDGVCVDCDGDDWDDFGNFMTNADQER